MADYQNYSTSSESDVLFNKKVFGEYYVMPYILGEGTYGKVYKVSCSRGVFAMKVEDADCDNQSLEYEKNILKYLSGSKVPRVEFYGSMLGKNMLIMELMGENLQNKLDIIPSKTFSVRGVCNIGIQIIYILEDIHNKSIIHRDIKPENFALGKKDEKSIYILDFGLSKQYRDSKTFNHHPMVNNKRLIGTARYASINALKGNTQSRRDDLEAVGYMLMYFLRGRLPWQSMRAKNKDEKYHKIMLKKQNTSAEELCEGFPAPFTEYIKYTRNLQYEQNPDYNYLKSLFNSILIMFGFKFDNFFDWDTNHRKNPFKHIEKEENRNYNNIGLISKPAVTQKSAHIFTVENKPNRIGSTRNLNKYQYNAYANNIDNRDVNQMNEGGCCIIF